MGIVLISFGVYLTSGGQLPSWKDANRSAVKFPAVSLHATFISLRNPNFRIYLASTDRIHVGAWIQITAENWLILQ